MLHKQYDVSSRRSIISWDDFEIYHDGGTTEILLQSDT